MALTKTKPKKPKVEQVVIFRATSPDDKVQTHGRTEAEALKLLTKIMTREGHSF